MPSTTQQDRARFRRVIENSKLPIAVFMEWVLGRDSCTAFRYLSDGEIPESTQRWFRHVESIEHRGDEIHIVLRWSRANRRWWPYVEHGHKRTFMVEERRVERNTEPHRHKRGV